VSGSVIEFVESRASGISKFDLNNIVYDYLWKLPLISDDVLLFKICCGKSAVFKSDWTPTSMLRFFYKASPLTLSVLLKSLGSDEMIYKERKLRFY
jgi:hypothetical protein